MSDRAYHYREAERLLTHTDRSIRLRYQGEGAECARQQLAAARVHALLASAPAEVEAEVMRCNCPRDMWYHAVNCPAHPGEEQAGI